MLGIARNIRPNAETRVEFSLFTTRSAYSSRELHRGDQVAPASTFIRAIHEGLVEVEIDGTRHQVSAQSLGLTVVKN